MQKRFEKGTENYELFNDYWKLRQQYYEPDNDEQFEELREAGERIIKKYQSTELAKLARNLVFAHFEDVEDRWKVEKEQIKT